ncbi:MAG: PAS domain S-box protein [Deltaproteobacteria bacterium]|nr:PAS domain S-box protein [Deltaproteobacteria bacterium]
MVCPSEPKTYRFLMAERKGWKRYGVAVVAVLAASLLRFVPEQFWPGTLPPLILFYPAVMIAVWYGGVGPGCLAILLSSLLGGYFFFPPRLSFGTGGRDWMHFPVFFFVSLIAIALIENLRRSLLQKREITRKLTLSQERITGFLESVQGCYFTLDRAGRFLYISENCKDYLPDSPAAYYGTSLWEAFGGWKDTEFAKKLDQALRDGVSSRFEFFETGANRWNEVHLVPTSDGVSVHIYDITSRKQAEAAFASELRFRAEAEAALRKSEGRLRRFIEANVIGVVFGEGKTHLITEANDAFLQMLGYDREDLEKRRIHWPSLIPPEYLEREWEKWRECLERGSVEPWEKECFRKDGSRIPVLAGATLLEREDETWAGFILDLTERKVQERRRATEYAVTQILAVDPLVSSALPKILQAVCEGTGWKVGSFWELNAVQRRLVCSEIWAQDPGEYANFIRDSLSQSLDRGQGLPGRVWMSDKGWWVEDLLRDDNFPRRDAAKRENLRSAFAFPIRIGEEFLGVMEFFAQDLRPPDPGLMAMLESVGSEIGQFLERKQAEEDLRVLQIRLNMALHAARMGYWSWDLKCNHLAWSDNLEFIHGRPAEEFEATFHNILDSIHPEDRDRVRKVFEGVLDEAPDYNFEFRTIWPNDSIHWIQVRGQVYYDEDGHPDRLIGLGIDITERKRAEEALKRYSQDLEKLVHERTVELANANMELHAEMRERQKIEREAVEAVQKEQQRLSAQLHDGLCQNLTGVRMMGQSLLQKMERRGFPESAEFNRLLELIGQSIEEARDMARGLFPVEPEANSLMMSLKGLALRTAQLYQVSCRFECPTPVLIEDNVVATHLYRLAQEAMQNAIRHGAATEVTLRLQRGGDTLSLEVQDNGRGLDGDAGSSPGIGLHLMKYRARLIDAELQFERLEDGTLFLCRLPMPFPKNASGMAG